MNPQAKNQQKVNGEEQPYTFSDKATKEKIKRHLTDIKDVITENDIANVKIPGKDDEPSPGDNSKNTEVEDFENLNDKPVTPWDSLEK